MAQYASFCLSVANLAADWTAGELLTHPKSEKKEEKLFSCISILTPSLTTVQQWSRSTYRNVVSCPLISADDD